MPGESEEREVTAEKERAWRIWWRRAEVTSKRRKNQLKKNLRKFAKQGKAERKRDISGEFQRLSLEGNNRKKERKISYNYMCEIIKK